MKKKKILFQTDWSLAKTGFGRNAKAIISYLYQTGKYEIVHYCCGHSKSDPTFKRTPWKSIGCLPDSEEELQKIQKDPNVSKNAHYGSYMLDDIIYEEKPDVYFAIQDIWGVDFAVNKPWFNEITSVIWTTLDSLPILPTALKVAPKIENYWIWSDFATKRLHDTGFKHVKTVHGAVDEEFFFRLPENKRNELRVNNNIPEDSFIIGFVFRNQLRKSVPNLLEGFKIFKDKSPTHKRAKLLFHTSLDEGWQIFKIAKEYNVPESDILLSYVCSECKQYQVTNLLESDSCPFCRSSNTFHTVNARNGVSEKQLNEVYNLMDVYCHPFTSGGQEIPIQEAKLTELITLVTNYSCGEEMCYPEAHSLPLDWSEYREFQSEFIKASTCPKSIAENLESVFDMPEDEKIKMGKNARKWTIENFSANKIGLFLENFIDKSPHTEFEFKERNDEKNPYAEIPTCKDQGQWVILLYKNILNHEVDEEDEGFQYWMKELTNGASPNDVENYFRKVALQQNSEQKNFDFEKYLDKEDKGKRILYVMPATRKDVFLSTSLFKSIKETYPNHNLYVATSKVCLEVLDANPYVHKVIPYFAQMDDVFWLEGQGDHEGFFEIAFSPYMVTQRHLNFIHNDKDKINYNVCMS